MTSTSSTPEHNFHPAYRPDIDGLRAVAILSVVIFHAFPTSLTGGFVGVDIFFVISGFLISSIIFKSMLRGDFSFAEFYVHRIKRIFPALILVLSASFVFGWFALLPDEFAQLGKHMAASAGFVQNFVLWKEAGYFDTASELKPLMHLWSLAIEEQFYLFYPLLIWGAWRAGLNVLTMVALLGLLSFGLNVAGVGEDAVKTFFLPQTRFWELLAGAVLAYVQLFKRAQFTKGLTRWIFHPAIIRQPQLSNQRKAVLNDLLSIVGLLLIVTIVCFLGKGNLFPGWWAFAPVLGSFLLIFAGPHAWVNRNILANRLMVFVGLISYPLYLWHWPLLSFARIVESEQPSLVIRLTAVVLSILLAWLTYRLIERPIRFGRKSWVKPAALCVLMVIVGFAGYNAFDRDGLQFRQNSAVQDRAAFGWPYYDNENCQQAYPSFARLEGDLCAKAKPSKPSILLMGDSHSNHLYPGLAEATLESEDNVLNLARAGCLGFADVAEFEKGRTDVCEEYTKRLLLFAEENSSIKVVVMSSRGPIYITGRGYKENIEGRSIALVSQPEIIDFRLVFRTAMRITIKRLLAKKKEIIFVLDVPELGFDPALCVPSSRPMGSTTRLKNPCAISRKDYDERNRDYRADVLSVLKEFPAVMLFDAAAQLCDDQYCWAMKDGKILYRNDNHLSIDGSRYLARELVKKLHPQ